MVHNQIVLKDIAEPCEVNCMFKTFPSNIPKGLRRYMLPYIHTFNEQLWKTYKLDGIRVLLHFDTRNKQVYMIDRLLHTYLIHTDFPTFLSGDMVLDGELLYLTSTNMTFFFAFDLIQYNNDMVSDDITMTLEKRYNILIELPTIKLGIINLCIKKFYPIYQHTTQPYSSSLPFSVIGLSHENSYGDDLMFPIDGIILTNIINSNDTIKWKPIPTIDVVMYKTDIHDEMIKTYFWEYDDSKGRKAQVLFKHCTIRNGSVKKSIESFQRKKVCVECSLLENEKWLIVGTRPDKDRSNSAHVIRDTIEIISDRVMEQEFTYHQPTTYDHWILDAWSQHKQLYELECRLVYKTNGSIEPTMFYHILSHCHNRFGQFEINRTIDYVLNDIRTTVHNDDVRTRTVMRKCKHMSYLHQFDNDWTMCLVLSSELQLSCQKTGGNNNILVRKKHRTRFVCSDKGLFIDFTIVSFRTGPPTFEIEVEYTNACKLKRDELFQFVSSIILL